MKLINFVPSRIQERQNRQRFVSVLILSAILAGGAVFASWIPLKAEVDSLKGSPTFTFFAKKTPKPTATPAVSQSLNIPDLTNRINQINILSQSEVNWPKAFQLVGDLTPKDVKLTTYTYAIGTSAPTLTFSGGAPDNLSFAIFVQSLNQSKVIMNPVVQGYTFSPGKSGVTFSISCQVPFNQISYLP